MTLQYNTEQEVNQSQFNLVRAKFSSLLAYRQEEDKFYIKPLCFGGYKKLLEQLLTSLE